MISVGIDLVYMPRLLKHLNDERWLKKILTEAEYRQFLDLSLERHRLEYFCGRFAAKEAYSKALKTGIGEVSFHDFEVLKLESGQPYSSKAEVSISHDHEYATAVVIINEEN